MDNEIGLIAVLLAILCLSLLINICALIYIRRIEIKDKSRYSIPKDEACSYFESRR